MRVLSQKHERATREDDAPWLHEGFEPSTSRLRVRLLSSRRPARHLNPRYHATLDARSTSELMQRTQHSTICRGDQ